MPHTEHFLQPNQLDFPHFNLDTVGDLKIPLFEPVNSNRLIYLTPFVVQSQTDKL